MKMGNIASPWRYDAILNTPLPQANARLFDRWHYDGYRGGVGRQLANLSLSLSLWAVCRSSTQTARHSTYNIGTDRIGKKSVPAQ
jgi:hypothetical protein